MAEPVGREELIQAQSTHPLNINLLNDSRTSWTFFLHELTICLFYYMEETIHSLRMRGLEIVDGGIEHQLLSQAALGSNPVPGHGDFEALLTLLESQQSPPE